MGDIVLPVVHPNGGLTIGDQHVPHQGISLEWTLETRSWAAVVRIPVILSEAMGVHTALYVAGGEAGTELAVIEESGETPGLALYALAKAVVRNEDARFKPGVTSICSDCLRCGNGMNHSLHKSSPRVLVPDHG